MAANVGWFGFETWMNCVLDFCLEFKESCSSTKSCCLLNEYRLNEWEGDPHLEFLSNREKGRKRKRERRQERKGKKEREETSGNTVIWTGWFFSLRNRFQKPSYSSFINFLSFFLFLSLHLFFSPSLSLLKPRKKNESLNQKEKNEIREKCSTLDFHI